MNKILLFGLIVLSSQYNLRAQSYGQIESRFTKSNLSKNDSLAFEKTAKEKLYRLMAYSKLYTNKETSSQTKASLKRKAEGMFRTNTQTGLVEIFDMDSLLLNLSSIIDSYYQSNDSLLSWKSNSPNFGKYQISNGKFELTVLLIKAPKSFGKNEEDIWQVYFCSPIFK